LDPNSATAITPRLLSITSRNYLKHNHVQAAPTAQKQKYEYQRAANGALEAHHRGRGVRAFARIGPPVLRTCRLPPPGDSETQQSVYKNKGFKVRWQE